MARPYSLDLRERVVARVAAGHPVREVAATFEVSVSSVVKWSQRAWLLARIDDMPDLTLRALVAELADRGIGVSYYAVWHFFEHEGISFKKKPARQRAGSARRGKAARPMEALPRK